jgi:hypothetical protein
MLRHGAVALVLLGGIGIAAAQTPGSTTGGTMKSPGMSQQGMSQQKLRLTSAQKSAIYKAVSQDKTKPRMASNFRPQIGAKIPPTIATFALPSNAVASAPAAASFKYTMAQNQVVLVDPATNEVVDIIRQ